MPTQRCPACGVLHDVGIFVSGQRVRCSACGLPFIVERPDSIMIDVASMAVQTGQARPAVQRAGPPKPKQAQPAQEAGEVPRAPRSDEDTSPAPALVSIPGFELFEVLGKGGMGRVYRARQVSLNRLVAIKVLNEDLAKHRSFIRRFEKETGALATLNHPNITSIIDRGHVGETYYFVMEYVGGHSLRRKMKPDGMELNQAVDLILILCQAIEHAHQRGVIHRDLKPENVLFTEEGVLKVADFGLANIVAPDKRWELTRTQVSMGTVNYMAPEQRRDAKHVDQRADIYSLGVMFYEMLVGELPLGRFEPPSRRRKNLDQRLDRLVLRMLDFDPDQRPQRAQLVAASLERIFGWRRTAWPAKDVVDSEQGTPLVGPAPGEPGSDQKEEVLLSHRPPPAIPSGARARPRLKAWFRGRRRVPALVVVVAGGLFLLALAAVGVATLLLYRNLGSVPGDLVLRSGTGGFQMQMVHPRQVKDLSPAAVLSQAGRMVVRYDFLPSTLAVHPVTFIGGGWDSERGRLVQDSCRSGFTINQLPARALFGRQAIPPEGAQLRVSLVAGPARRDPGWGRAVTVEQYLDETLGGLQRLMPLSVQVRVGVGMLTKDGDGLEVLFSLEPEEWGSLVRTGEGMEGGGRDFPLNGGVISPGKPSAITLAFHEGRVRVSADDRLLLDDLAGFPLGFKGYPTISCKNARCSFLSVEYSRPH